MRSKEIMLPVVVLIGAAYLGFSSGRFLVRDRRYSELRKEVDAVLLGNELKEGDGLAKGVPQQTVHGLEMGSPVRAEVERKRWALELSLEEIPKIWAEQGEHLVPVTASIILRRWAEADWDSAWEAVKGMIGGQTYSYRAVVINTLAESDLEGALAMAHERDPNLVNGILWSAAKRDPHGVFERAKEFEAMDTRKEALKVIFGQWYRMDASEAVAVAAALVAKQSDWKLLPGVVEGIFESDQRTALSLLADLPGSYALEIVEGFFTSYFMSRPNEMVDTLLTMNPVEVNPAFAEGIASRLVMSNKKDVEDLMQRSDEQWPESEARAAFQYGVVHALASDRQRVDEAAAWTHKLSPGKWRDAVIKYTALRFGSLDADAALEWADAFQDPSERDLAVGNAVSPLLSDDPSKAMEWVATLEDPEFRALVQSNYAKRWYEKDAEQAVAWLEAHQPGVIILLEDALME